MEVLMIILKVILALVFTILIEGVILFQLKERRLKIYIAMIIMNVVTNVPLNVFSILALNKWDLGFIVLFVPCIEIGIALIETLAYYFYTKEKTRSIIYGIFCNAYSYIIGAIINWVLFTILSLGF